MKNVRRTRITVEKEWSVVRSRNLQQSHCHSCGREVAVIWLDEAVKITEMSLPSIRLLIEEGKLHAQELTDGVLVICFESVAALQLRSQPKTLND